MIPQSPRLGRADGRQGHRPATRGGGTSLRGEARIATVALAKIDDRSLVDLLSRRGTCLDDAFRRSSARCTRTCLPAPSSMARWSGGTHQAGSSSPHCNAETPTGGEPRPSPRPSPANSPIFDVLEEPKHGDLRRTKLAAQRRILGVPSGTPLASSRRHPGKVHDPRSRSMLSVAGGSSTDQSCADRDPHSYAGGSPARTRQRREGWDWEVCPVQPVRRRSPV